MGKELKVILWFLKNTENKKNGKQKNGFLILDFIIKKIKKSNIIKINLKIYTC